MAAKKGGLGRGLDALFSEQVPVIEESNNADTGKKTKADTKADVDEGIKYIKIHDIKPNPNQPRKVFNEEKLSDLANSIIENGIIQPIVVRPVGKTFEIVAGERRWRAAMKAELNEVPCLVRELSEEQNMLFAIIENMQREDLNPIEEAEGINRMISTFKLTQEQVSKSVGKSRPYIANSLRLLKLPEKIKEMISEGQLSAAHGRTLCGISDEARINKLAERIVKEGISVRELELIAQQKDEKPKKKSTKKIENDPNLASIEDELKTSLGTKVKINRINSKRGKIEIEYYSKEELDRLIELLKEIK